MNGLLIVGGAHGTHLGPGPERLKAAAAIGPPPQALPGLHPNGLPLKEQTQSAQFIWLATWRQT